MIFRTLFVIILMPFSSIVTAQPESIIINNCYTYFDEDKCKESIDNYNEKKEIDERTAMLLHDLIEGVSTREDFELNGKMVFFNDNLIHVSILADKLLAQWKDGIYKIRQLKLNFNDEDELIKNAKLRIEIYKNIIEQTPYSRFSVISQFGIVYHSLIIYFSSDFKRTDFLELASYYISPLVDEDSLSETYKSLNSWPLYNDALFLKAIIDIFTRDNVDYTLNKLREYNYVADKFGIKYKSNGEPINIDYVDQVYIGDVIPGLGVNVNRYFSNSSASNFINSIKMDLIDVENKLEMKRFVKMEMSNLKHDDITIVVKSYKLKEYAEENLDKYNKIIKDDLKDYTFKVIKPSNGQFWGIGLGNLDDNNADFIGEILDSKEIEYFKVRPRVDD